MAVTIELSPSLEARLEAEAERLGLQPAEYIQSLLESSLKHAAEGEPKTAPTRPYPRTGKELLERLQESGLIGMWADRDDIGDSSEFARKLREQAQNRGLTIDPE